MRSFAKFFSIFCIACVLSGCSAFKSDTNNNLSPKDTITEERGSDEIFLEESDLDEDQGPDRESDDMRVARSFDDEKTEYNYTQSDVVGAIFFGFDDSNILGAEREKLKKIANVLLRKRAKNVLVVGNCDRFGGEEYNYSLGRRRADAVRNVMIGFGISPASIRTASLGSSRANKQVRQKSDGKIDRRCDVVLLK